MKRLLLLVVCSLPIFAQATRTDPFPASKTFGSSNTANPPILVVPNAIVTLCNYPANGTPCTNFATSYTDATGITACPTNKPVVWAGSNTCSATTDTSGRFGFWLHSGNYTYMLSVNGQVRGPFPLSTGGGSGGGGTPGGGSGQVQYNNGGVFAGLSGSTITVLHGNASGPPSYGPVNLATDLTGTLPTSQGGTGTTSAGTAISVLHGAGAGYSQIDLANDTSNILPVAKGGNGTATPALIAGANVNITGSWPALTIAATGSTGSLPGGAAGQIQINNSGSFGALPGTTTTVLHGNASGAASFGAVNLLNDITGILAKANGGTGTASPGLVAGTNVTLSGTWPNQTVNATGTPPSGLTGQVQINNAGAFGALPGTTTTVLHGNAAGAASFGAVNQATDITGLTPVANGGTGTATPSLVAGANMSVSGTWPNQTVAAATGGPPGGTAGQVQVNNSGSFGALAGTTTTVLHGNAAGAATYGAVNLAADVSGITPVANGGNGTSTPALVAGTNITLTGTWPNFTIAAANTLPGGTVGQVQLNNTGTFSGLAGTTTTVLHGNAAGAATYGAVNQATDITGITPVVNGGTGTATPAIVAGTNVTVSGTWPNQTVNSTAGGGTVNTNSINGGTPITAVAGNVDLPIPVITSGSSTVATGTTTIGINLSQNPRVVAGTTDTLAVADCAQGVVRYTNAASVAIALAQAGVNVPSGCVIELDFEGAAGGVVTPSTSSIGGAATLTATGGTPTAPSTVTLRSDGTNFKVSHIGGAGVPTTNASLLTTGTLDGNRISNTVSSFAGADYGAQANACLAAQPAGGYCNNPGTSTGTVAATTTIAVPAGKTLILSGLTLNTSANPGFTIGQSGKLEGSTKDGTTVNLTTSGATGVRAACYLTPCAASLTGIKVQGITFHQNTVNTGIGLDFSAITRGSYSDLTFQNFGIAIGNSLGCQGGAGTPGCYHNEFLNINVVGGVGTIGVRLQLSANAEKFFALSFSGGLTQFLVGDTGASQVTDEVNCFGCTFEQPDIMAPPAAPTLGGAGGAGTACVKVEYVTYAGYTLPSSETCTATLLGNNLTVTSPAAVAGALGWVPFAGATTGTELFTTAAGTCTGTTVNSVTICNIGATWSQTGALSSNTRGVDTVNSSGAAIAVNRGQNINFYGGRCEPGAGNAGVCVETYPDAQAGPVVVSGMFMQFATASTPFNDRSGQIIRRDSNLHQFHQMGTSSYNSPNLIKNHSFEAWDTTAHALGWNSVASTNWASGTSEMTRTVVGVHGGTYAAALGDTNTLNKGVATDRIPVDPTTSYTLSYDWATANTTTGYRLAVRQYDSLGAIITDTALTIPAKRNAGSGGAFATQNLTFSATFNAYIMSANQLLGATVVEDNEVVFFQPSPNCTSIQVGWVILGTAVAGVTTVYLDDVYLAQGTAENIPQDALQQDTNYAKPVQDSGNAGNAVVNAGLVAPIYSTTIGTAIASAATIAPNMGTFHVTGVAAIGTITPPLFCLTGSSCEIHVIPDGVFTWTNAGNISLAGTAVVGKVIIFVYDPVTTKFYPSTTS